jgi:uncharacterized protein (TIGR00369 family)
VSAPAPRDPAYAERVRASFARQAFLRTLGAELARVAPGEVVIALGARPELGQQHGYVHAGVLATVADSACGFAALTLMAPGDEVLSVEFKLNLLTPAAAERFEAVGRVVRAGRTLTVCAGEVRAAPGADGAPGALVALMQATMIAVRDRPAAAAG